VKDVPDSEKNENPKICWGILPPWKDEVWIKGAVWARGINSSRGGEGGGGLKGEREGPILNDDGHHTLGEVPANEGFKSGEAAQEGKTKMTTENRKRARTKTRFTRVVRARIVGDQRQLSQAKGRVAAGEG